MLSSAVILAGGRGTRLGDATRETPKPLLPVAGRPFLEYLIENLRRFGIHRIVLSVGYLGDAIATHFGDGSRYGVSIETFTEREPLGTGGALRLAAGDLQGPFLAVNGDTLFDLNYLDLARLVEGGSALAALALRQVPAAAPFGNVQLDGFTVTGFREKSESGPGIVNGGVYAMRREALERLPAGGLSLERDLFPALASDRRLAGKVYGGFFLDIGSPESLEAAHDSVPRWWRRPAVFLDRDGVINVDRGYVHDPERFVWTEGAPEAIKWLNDWGYLVIVVTNQSGIARGYYSEANFLAFTGWINEQLRERGAHIDATYHCPHHPTEGSDPYRTLCECRKPAPGLIRRAISDWNVDVAGSLLVGDTEQDRQAAATAKIPFLLFTGGNLLEGIRGCVPERQGAPAEWRSDRSGEGRIPVTR